MTTYPYTPLPGSVKCIYPLEYLPKNCINSSINGTILSAQCEISNNNESINFIPSGIISAHVDRKQKTFRNTSIDLNKCAPFSIKNIDGQLTCNDGYGLCSEKNEYTLPSGLWQTTCRNPFMNKTILNAQCYNGYDKFFNTSIDLSMCVPNTIRNIQGKLICIPGL